MLMPFDEWANESRTQSVGIKRSSTSLDDQPSGPRSKRLRRQGASKRATENLTQPIGEEYGFETSEYKFHLLGKEERTIFNKNRRLADLPTFHLKSSNFSALKAARPPTQMDKPPSNDCAGANPRNKGSSGAVGTRLRGNVAPMDVSRLGNNRLATGFSSASVAAAPSPDSLESGETRSTPIEISSDDDEGGMVLNVEGQPPEDAVHSGSEDRVDDEYEDSDEEMGDDQHQMHSSTSVSFPRRRDFDTHMQIQGDLERHLSNDFKPLSIAKAPSVRLADLTPEKLEEQYKYSFYGFERDQIDLARPVVCLECLHEGHISNTCPQIRCQLCDKDSNHHKLECPKTRRCTKCRERGHDAAECQSKLKQEVVCELCRSNHHVETKCSLRFFPPVKSTNTSSTGLWISCCKCASKAHLVGDCPSVHPDDAPRWSLRNLNSRQIINLSLQTGISGLEKAAENRNMRPQGRDIRPGFVNQRKTFDSDSNSDESFLRAPVRHQNPKQKGNINFAPPPRRNSANERYPLRSNSLEDTRYDRYDAPSTVSSTASNRNRGNEWYNTDSFGQERQRRRSRSPEQAVQRNIGGVNSYRPPGGQSSRSWQPPLPSGPPPNQNYRPREADSSQRRRKQHQSAYQRRSGYY